MRIRTSDDFRRARRRRRTWVISAGSAAGALLLILFPEWLEVSWGIYPLPRAFEEIAQNLFWAFTTSTIFMLFENNVNGGGTLLERYRDIEASVEPLPTGFFSTEFLLLPEDPEQRSRFEHEMGRSTLLGWPGIQQFIETWGDSISFETYEETLGRYREYAERCQAQIARNHLVFSPSGLEENFEELFRKRCGQLTEAIQTFASKGLRNGPYWILEEDIARSIVMEFNAGTSDEVVYGRLGDALTLEESDWPILMFHEIQVEEDGRRLFSIAPQLNDQQWDYFYAPIGEAGDWATPNGSRDLSNALNSANAITENEFWSAPPKRILSPTILGRLLEEVATLANFADRYNHALEQDLIRAREFALALN